MVNSNETDENLHRKENESTVKQSVMVLRHLGFVQFIICVATDVLETTQKHNDAQVHKNHFPISYIRESKRFCLQTLLICLKDHDLISKLA